MKKSLFITGATGFIGTELLKKLDIDSFEMVYCLGRKETPIVKELENKDKFKFLRGDISEISIYEEYLDSSTILVHLAAVTGKAAREKYFEVNSGGTELIIEKCVQKQVRGLIFMSTIAAKFVNLEGYYYAQSKIDAERAIRRSGIPYIILRPTIVIGKESSILKSLMQLSKLPFVPVFGDGMNRVQPVYIDDVVNSVLKLFRDESFTNETVTVAGPDQMTMEDLIKRIHDHVNDKTFRAVHLPVYPIIKSLLYLEKHFLSYLPFTAGQMASFTNDGIDDRAVDTEELSGRCSVDEMLELSLRKEKSEVEDPDRVKRECEYLTKYLIGIAPDNYVKEKYIKGHERVISGRRPEKFDTLLMNIANRGTFFLKLADVYTSFFYKRSLLRTKLLLILGILESYGATYSYIDKADGSSKLMLIINMGKKYLISLLMFLFSVILLLPVKIIVSARKTENG